MREEKIDTTRVFIEQTKKAQAEGKTPEQAFLEMILEAVSADLAETILLGAIPDYIDEKRLQRLRGKREGCKQLLEQLSDYSFVRPNPEGGGYIYDEETRRLLLQIWSEKDPNRLKKLMDRLDKEVAKPAKLRTGVRVWRIVWPVLAFLLVGVLLIAYLTSVQWGNGQRIGRS